MLITHLELENFKSYAHASIDFEAGTNAIVGANGAGKSSLIEAIGLALFDAHVGKLADYVREGERTSSVVVRFISSADEREYEVERQFGKSTTRYRAYDPERGHSVEAEGGRDVLTWIHQHLGTEPDGDLGALFRDMIGVHQGTLTAPFLESNSSVRKAIFGPVLRVDEYEKAWRNLGDVRRHLDDKSTVLQKSIARMEGEVSDLPRLQLELTELESEIETQQASIRAGKADADRIQQELQEAEIAARRILQLETELGQVHARLTAQRRMADQAQQTVDQARRAAAQLEQTKAGYLAYNAAQTRIDELEQQRRDLDRVSAEINRLENQLSGVKARLENSLAQLETIALAAARMIELGPHVAEQERLESELDQAKQDSARLAQYRVAQDRAAQELAAAQQYVTRLEAKLEEATDIERKQTTRQQQIDRATAQREAEQAALALKDTESRHLREQTTLLEQVETALCPLCEAELTANHRLELISRNQTHIRNLDTETNTLSEQIASLEQELVSWKEESKRATQRLRSLPTDDELSDAQQQLQRRETELARANETLAPLLSATTHVTELESALAALGDPRNTLRACQAQLDQRQNVEQDGDKLRGEADGLRTQIQNLTQEMPSASEVADELAKARSEQDRCRGAYQAHIGSQSVASQLPALELRCGELEAEWKALAGQAQALAATLDQARSLYDPENHERLKRRDRELSSTISVASGKLENAMSRIDSVSQRVGKLLQVQEEIIQQQQNLARIQALQDLVGWIRSLIREAGPLVIGRLVERISRSASTLYGDIMDDHTGRLTWNSDFELTLDTGGQQRQFSQLSGGEQMSAALALRLALIRETTGVDIAFFDEPTAHLDPMRREALAEQIMHIRGFSQLFVISHDDSFEQHAQNYIHIARDAQGSHEVSADA